MRSRAKPENKERLLDMIRMKLEGYSLREISDKYNVSYQYVQQELETLSSTIHETGGYYNVNIIFSNIAKWMRENQITLKKLQKIIGLKSSTSLVKNRLCGKSQFRMPEIKRLLEFTGMTFEYLFAEDGVDYESE